MKRLNPTIAILSGVALPAMAQAPAPAPADREITFPGFNGFPLHASVRAGGAHPYFAVMVAGSGPTDRDWSNPMIPVASHAGRDFAGWLQAQGLGSLRYDKRFIGSRDPRLDISLDAQAGDLKAALAAARALPEAKGKKLLLVGHGEGALLALLAAGGADATLLLALPGRDMATTIKEHLRPQLPPEKAAANLAYLDQVFQAIRRNQPTPEPGADVYPALGRLAKGLMAPETLDFVRDTLDLDPWTLAARLTGPAAIVWGDSDVQTWRPATVPATYHGAVIDLPGANLLLRRETRSRADLTPASAMTAYGDATPLADLTPLAAWLKGLK